MSNCAFYWHESKHVGNISNIKFSFIPPSHIMLRVKWSKLWVLIQWLDWNQRYCLNLEELSAIKCVVGSWKIWQVKTSASIWIFLNTKSETLLIGVCSVDNVLNSSHSEISVLSYRYSYLLRIHETPQSSHKTHQSRDHISIPSWIVKRKIMHNMPIHFISTLESGSAR